MVCGIMKYLTYAQHCYYYFYGCHITYNGLCNYISLEFGQHVYFGIVDVYDVLYINIKKLNLLRVLPIYMRSIH